MKILTNRRNKNAIRASNNQVVFYKNQVCCIKLSLKMKSRIPNKDSEQLSKEHLLMAISQTLTQNLPKVLLEHKLYQRQLQMIIPKLINKEA